MNRYAEMAFDHWRQHRPQAVASMTTPSMHFARLGEEVETRVIRLRDEILGAQRPGETLESYRLRSYQARRQAEEVVMTELVWVEAEPASEPEGWEDETDPELVAHYRNLALISETLSAQPAAWTDTPVEVVARP